MLWWKKIRPWSFLLAGLGFTLWYFLSRIFALTALPVFADESIYIRWAQLILHEPSRYLFFSLNDGKPPLFIWTLASVLSDAFDPLWRGRMVSVFLGFIQLAVMDQLTQSLGGGWRARALTLSMILLAPFWFFHQRMALFDTMLTLFLSLTLLGLLLIGESRRKVQAGGVVLAGVSFGLALWTKTPALLLSPFFVMSVFLPLFQYSEKPRSFWKKLPLYFAFYGLAGFLGLSLFFLLRFQPTFGSLFSRSSDFTFTVNEVLSGSWRTSIDNVGRLIDWLSAYLRPELLSLAALALIFSSRRRTHWYLWLGAIIFSAPLLILGKTLHPRYFLPVAPFLTLSAGLFAEESWRVIQRSKESFIRIIAALLVFFFAVGSLRFQFLSYFTPDQTPFVLHDREQYLTEWSSGHGIIGVRNLLIERARRGEYTTVVTEGSFGTLPDALLMYFDQRPEIRHLRIEGLAQYPVKFLPDWVWQTAEEETVWLVVNEHRLAMPTDQLELVARFPRPYGGPDLHVYLVHPLKK